MYGYHLNLTLLTHSFPPRRFADLPVLPVGHPRQLRFFKFNNQCHSQTAVMYPAMAQAIAICSDIDKCRFLAAADMVLQWWFSFFKRQAFPENPRFIVSFARCHRTLPADIHTLID